MKNILTEYEKFRLEQDFYFLWRDELIHIPPLDKMSYDEYNKLKDFVWKSYLILRENNKSNGYDFDYVWRNELIHIPPLDKMTYKEYDKLKEIARQL